MTAEITSLTRAEAPKSQKTVGVSRWPFATGPEEKRVLFCTISAETHGKICI